MIWLFLLKKKTTGLTIMRLIIIYLTFCALSCIIAKFPRALVNIKLEMKDKVQEVKEIRSKINI